MKKDEIFFGKEGLTSTEANHIANMAKEYINTNSNMNLMFYNTSIETLNNQVITKTNNKTSLKDLEEKLERMAKATSLISWLREAIKAKDRLILEMEALSLENYCIIKNIEYPKNPNAPLNILTDNEYYGSLPIKEREKYYTLEAFASVYGKFIHPKGDFITAKEKLVEVIQTPTKLGLNGNDTIIYNYEPLVSISYVEAVFFELQVKYRDVQAQLNKYKADCENAIKRDSIYKYNSYREALSKYQSAKALLETELSSYKAMETERIGKLKIIIPDDLKDIYSKISNLGK